MRATLALFSLSLIAAEDTEYSECRVVDEKKEGVAVINTGDTKWDWTGVIPARDIPCTHAGIDILRCEGENCLYPFQMAYTETEIALPPWPTQFTTSRNQPGYFQWVPRHSCAAIGPAATGPADKWCTVLTWEGEANNCYGDQLFFGAPCYCDDACTNYMDCCFDYLWQCSAADGLFPGFYGAESELGDMELPTTTTTIEFGRSPASQDCPTTTTVQNGIQVMLTGTDQGSEQGGTYIKIADLPCAHEGVYLKTCDGEECLYPITASNSDLKIGVGPWWTEIANSRLSTPLMLKWIPYNSCAARSPYSCNKLDWPNADYVCFSGYDVGETCFCDDACTNYKDCCYDYQWTCGIGLGHLESNYGPADEIGMWPHWPVYDEEDTEKLYFPPFW